MRHPGKQVMGTIGGPLSGRGSGISICKQIPGAGWGCLGRLRGPQDLRAAWVLSGPGKPRFRGGHARPGYITSKMETQGPLFKTD